jgi:hypothetical protein
LQARSQKLRAQWAAGAAQGAVARRYEGGKNYQGDVIGAEPNRQEAPPAAQPPEEPKRPKPPESTHIDQLLQARRRKAGQDEK